MFTKKFISFLILCWSIALSCNAQSLLNNEWYVTIKKSKLKFADDTAFNTMFFENDTSFIYSGSGNSSISDNNGNMLMGTNSFYGIGNTINGTIDNYTLINNDSFAKTNGYVNLYSNCSILLPLRNNKYIVFITTISNEKHWQYFNVVGDKYFWDNLLYSTIEVQNNNAYKIVQNRVLLLNTTDTPFLNHTCLTATRHANGKDWWLVKPSGDKRQKHYVFYVSADTTYLHHVQYNAGFAVPGNFVYTSGGQSNFSQDGTLYAEVNSNGPVSLYGFDRCSGWLTPIANINATKFHKDSLKYEPSWGGVCFSPNNKYLYLAESFFIHQIDITTPLYPMQVINPIDTNKNFALHNALQLTPKGQIYIGHWGGVNNRVDAIMEPNNYGLACNFKPIYCKIING